MTKSAFNVPDDAKAAYDSVAPLLDVTAIARSTPEGDVGVEVQIGCQKDSPLWVSLSAGEALADLMAPIVSAVQTAIVDSFETLIIESGELPRGY